MKKEASKLTRIAPFHVMDILARANQLRAQGRSIIHLEIGEPDFPTPDPIIEAGVTALRRLKTHYTAATGLPELRGAIADYYHQRFDAKVSAEQIIITPGASGALQTILSYVNGPGLTLMIGDPAYPCNRALPKIYRGETLLVPVTARDRYQLSLEQVKSYWHESVNAILIASPANPTGAICRKEELLAIADFLHERNAFLIVDEIYQGLVYDGDSETVAGARDNIFVINSFSKYFGMMGWRLGWLVCPADHYASLDSIAQNTYLAPSTIAQYAALAAFDGAALELCESRRQAFKKRRDFLVEQLRDMGCEIPVVPEGAFYIYVNMSRWCKDSFIFCRDLLEKMGVAITPGCDFGEYQADQYVRFAYTTSMENIEEGCRRLRQYLCSIG